MTLKDLLKSFWARKDVWFSFGGMLMGSLLIYADRMPWWLLALLVTLREIFGFVGMTKNQNGTADQKQSG